MFPREHPRLVLPSWWGPGYAPQSWNNRHECLCLSLCLCKRCSLRKRHKLTGAVYTHHIASPPCQVPSSCWGRGWEFRMSGCCSLEHTGLLAHTECLVGEDLVTKQTDPCRDERARPDLTSRSWLSALEIEETGLWFWENRGQYSSSKECFTQGAFEMFKPKGFQAKRTIASRWTASDWLPEILLPLRYSLFLLVWGEAGDHCNVQLLPHIARRSHWFPGPVASLWPTLCVGVSFLQKPEKSRRPH